MSEVLWIDRACARCGLPVAVRVAGPASSGGPFGSGEPAPCSECRGESFAFSRAIAAAEYRGPMRQLVLGHKFRGDHGARRFLARALAAAASRAGLRFCSAVGPEAITWVPRHFARRLRTGHDPGRELALAFGREIERDVVGLLRKRRITPPQTSLDRSRRRRSVRGSVSLRRGARVPERVLLVDDVLTTGATTSECARALRAGGARRVVVLCAARS